MPISMLWLRLPPCAVSKQVSAIHIQSQDSEAVWSCLAFPRCNAAIAPYVWRRLSIHQTYLTAPFQSVPMRPMSLVRADEDRTHTLYSIRSVVVAKSQRQKVMEQGLFEASTVSAEGRELPLSTFHHLAHVASVECPHHPKVRPLPQRGHTLVSDIRACWATCRALVVGRRVPFCFLSAQLMASPESSINRPPSRRSADSGAFVDVDHLRHGRGILGSSLCKVHV